MVVLHALIQVLLRGREKSEAMSGHDPFFVKFRSVVRGYHVYKRVWTPVLGEHALYRRMRIAAIYHLFIIKVLPKNNSGRHLVLYLERKNSINGQVALKLQWRLNYSKYGIYNHTWIWHYVSQETARV